MMYYDDIVVQRFLCKFTPRISGGIWVCAWETFDVRRATYVATLNLSWRPSYVYQCRLEAESQQELQALTQENQLLKLQLEYVQ